MKGNFGTGHLCNSGSAEITWVCVPAICVFWQCRNYLGRPMCAEIISLSCNVLVKEL